MKIAVLSGKGGTGKTTVSVSIAASLGSCQYIDCDVEEPNGAIFLKPEITRSEDVRVMVPVIDDAACDGCGACAQACRFHAIAAAGKKVLLFPELCHSCGACRLSCPSGAISEGSMNIGVVESNKDGTFLQGRLNIGQRIALPIIKELKRRVRDDIPAIIDAPPGASCSVAAATEDCDYCLLVAEPTPFGLHNLNIAAALVRMASIPFGVVINKATRDDSTIHDYCAKHNIPVLMEIPFSKEIAQNYSQGLLPAQTGRLWEMKFIDLYEKAARRARA